MSFMNSHFAENGLCFHKNIINENGFFFSLVGANAHRHSHIVFLSLESCPKKHHLNRHLLQSSAITQSVLQLKEFVCPH